MAAAPDLTKSWQLVPNVVCGASYGGQLRTIKDTLCGFAKNPWRVISSSNSTVAGSGDNWVSDADAGHSVTASGARSWIVLQNASGMQICFDYINHGTGDVGEFRMSPRGLFTGGTVSARPTATDELPEVGAPTVLGSPPYQKQWTLFSTAKILHIWHTTDGLQSMIVGYQGTTGSPDFGALETFWILGQAEQKHPAWGMPHVMFIGTAGNATNPNNLFNLNDWIIAEDTQGKYQLLSTTAEAYYDGSNYQVITSQGINQISNTYPEEPLSLWSGKYKCEVGKWPVDVYPTTTDTGSYITGSFIPGDGSKKFVKVNGLLIPWDGVSSWTFPS